MEGVDVFDMKPLEMDRIGTMENPIKIYSLVSMGVVGNKGHSGRSG